MSAGKNQHIPGDCAQAVHNPIGSLGNLLWRFSSRRAVAEELPFRTLCMDLHASSAFIVAVVPFEQIWIDFSDSTEAG
jgi:hypothetical protein